MHWLTLLVLLLVTIGYLFIGAAVFQELESTNEQETKSGSRERIKYFLQNATCVSREELERLVQGIIEAYDQGVLVTNKTESADNWDLWSSFFFSATVVTTIGYGHISPSTTGGRLFCIFYAIIGIPLVAVFLTGIGFKIYKPIHWFKKRSQSTCGRIAKSVIFGLFGFGLLIFLPAYGFHRTEDWTMFEGIYYCVITLTTVGFGDFVPGQQEGVDYRAGRQLVTLVWIFVALAWAAVMLADVADFFKDRFSKIGEKPKEDDVPDVYDAEAVQANGKGSDKAFTAL